MPVNFMEFLASAKNISQGNSEIDFRNSTSRAYYAAYHEAKRVSSHSNHPGHQIKGKGSHEIISERLKKHSGTDPEDQDIRRIGFLLDQCKKQRVKADYKLQSSYTNVENDSLILQVERLVRLSANLP